MFVVRAKRLVVRGMERQPAIATRGPSRQPCFSASHSRGARTSRSNGREEARPAHARRPRPLARLEHLNQRVSGRAACDGCHRKQAKPVAGPAVRCRRATADEPGLPCAGWRPLCLASHPGSRTYIYDACLGDTFSRATGAEVQGPCLWHPWTGAARHWETRQVGLGKRTSGQQP